MNEVLLLSLFFCIYCISNDAFQPQHRQLMYPKDSSTVLKSRSTILFAKGKKGGSNSDGKRKVKDEVKASELDDSRRNNLQSASLESNESNLLPVREELASQSFEIVGNPTAPRKGDSVTDDMMEIPVGGIKGYKMGSLYNDGFDIEDPLFNPILASLDSLPGEDGSPERLAAIQNLVETRKSAISELKDPARYDYMIDKVPQPPKSTFEEALRYFTFTSTGYPRPRELLNSFVLDVVVATIIIGFTFGSQFLISNFLRWWMYDVELPGWLVDFARG